MENLSTKRWETLSILSLNDGLESKRFHPCKIVSQLYMDETHHNFPEILRGLQLLR